MGIDSTRIIQLTFVISGLLAGVAGVFLGIKYTLYPTLGSLVVRRFIASVIGGLGSLTGAIIGAVLLGLTETILLSMLGSGYSTIATFAIMLVFLLVRPQGIAGSKHPGKRGKKGRTNTTQVFITLSPWRGWLVRPMGCSAWAGSLMAIGPMLRGFWWSRRMPLVPAIIIAVALATLVGYLIGYPVVRLRREYLACNAWVRRGHRRACHRMTSLTGRCFRLYGNSAQDHTHP